MSVFRYEQPIRTKSNSPRLLPELEPLPWLMYRGEKRAFIYFLEQSAPILSGALDYGFWNVLVPRMAESNMVVRYAIFAISHFWENPVRSHSNGLASIHPISRKHLSALEWHAKALSANRMQSDAKATTDIMLKCTLFSALEFQQNNFQSGLRLIRIVFTMLAPLLTTGGSSPQSMPADDVADMLVQMAMRNSSLVLTLWDDHGIAPAPDSPLDNVQAAVYRAMLMVYAGLKDTYLARLSNARTCIDRLLLTYTQIRYSLRMLKDRLGAIGTIADGTSSHRVQALREYCDISLAWLDSLSNTALLHQDAAEYLAEVLMRTSSIEAQAHLFYPIAASTTFFHQMAILPAAYLVAVFATNAGLRADALALMKWKRREASKAQPPAIVMSLEGDVVDSIERPFTDRFQLRHEPTHQPQILYKIYQIPIQPSAPVWQPPKPVDTEPIQTSGFWTSMAVTE